MRRIQAVFSLLASLFLSASSATAGVTIRVGTATGARSPVHFYIEDSAGRKSGQNASGQYFSEIPGTSGHYISPSVGDANTGDPDLDYVELTAPLPAGHYKIVVIPLATTSYFLHYYAENDALAYSEFDRVDFAIAGSTRIFEFDYSTTASTLTPAAKTVTSNSLRQNVDAAHQLNQLGDAAFVSRLQKMLAKAESFAAKGQKKQAADRLDQFIHRLESAFKKEPDPDADDDPADKNSTGSMKRFILLQARDMLQADARALIISLGETPKR